jgi:alpha-tubulin suppressor-like RCC1 family protein
MAGAGGCEAGEPVACADATTRLLCGVDGQPVKPTACPTATPYCTGKGECVECMQASQCPAVDQECLIPACTGGVCGAAPVASGVASDKQIPHDCARRVCDGMGGISVVPDASDTKEPGSDACLVPVCDGLEATMAPAPLGTACDLAGSPGVCNGMGNCGECTPGESKCTDENGATTCSPEGHWGVVTVCGASTPVCSEGACVGVVQVSTNGETDGPQHTCALLADGHLRCWGSNSTGQLGTGEATYNEPRPQTAKGIGGISLVATGGRHTCVIASGEVWCWGRGSSGQLGNGELTTSPVPVSTGLTGVTDLSAGSHHTCAIAQGKVYCWGENTDHQLGFAGTGSAVPTEIPSLAGATMIRLSERASCAVGDFDGGTVHQQVRCWGDKIDDQLGTDSAPGDSPKAVIAPQMFPDTLQGVAELAVGPTHACASLSNPDQDTYCWGKGKAGNFGDEGNSLALSHAVKKQALSHASQLTAGLDLTCLIKSTDSRLRCTGTNSSGQLGNGSFVSNGGVPSLIPLPAVTTVCAGQGQVCAIAGGQLYCWGQNTYGQLGIGSYNNMALPTAVHW